MLAPRVVRRKQLLVLAASLSFWCSAEHISSFSSESSGLQGITVSAYGGGKDPSNQCREGDSSFLLYDIPIDPQAEFPGNCQAINAGHDDAKYYSGYCTPDKTYGVLMMWEDAHCTELRLNLSQAMDQQLSTLPALAIGGVAAQGSKYSFLTGNLPIGPIVDPNCKVEGSRAYAAGCISTMSDKSRITRNDGVSSCIGPMHGNGSNYYVTSGDGLDPSLAMMYISFKCGFSCFPSSSMVTLADGSAMRIDELQQGDAILAAHEDGSLYMDTVSMFSLADSAAAAPMVSLQTDDGHRLRFTVGHHIPVGPECCSKLAQAKDIKQGETVWVAVPGATSASARRVAHVAAEMGQGLHNPLLTHGGFPVVDGVITSFNSIEVVRLDRAFVPFLSAACAATGTCDALRRLVSGLDCFLAGRCKDQRFVDGLALRAGAPHIVDTAVPLVNGLLLALAMVGGAAAAGFLAMRPKTPRRL